VVDQHRRGRLRVARSQAPGFLHTLGMHAHHGTHLLPLCRNPGAAELARPPGAANPLGRGPRLNVRVGDPDVAAKTDDIAKAQIRETRTASGRRNRGQPGSSPDNPWASFQPDGDTTFIHKAARFGAAAPPTVAARPRPSPISANGAQ
jgi:hypothetical protein